ncbi:MAG: M3 family metallopeptidase [Brevundimonas sp.]
MNRRQMILTSAGVLAVTACATAPAAYGPTETVMTGNPLADPWAGPYQGVPPWDQVTPDLLRDALNKGIEQMRADVAAVANNPEPATFENTILPMERGGQHIQRAGSIFGVMIGNIGSADYQALNREMSPILSAASDEITFNEVLFQRIRTVHENAEAAGLTAEQRRLVEREYEGLVRNGAALDAAGKAELGRINQALSTAFTNFQQKVVADEQLFTHIAAESGVAGLPDSNKSAAAEAARSRDLSGYVIVNTRSAVDPFLSFGDDRAMREQIWRKFVNRGDNGDANDTNATIAEILGLRAERARLLGFETHAHWRMQDTMAGTPEAAMELMMRVWPPAVARVSEEVAEMTRMAGHEIEPWDYLYYLEKVRKERYDLDQNDLKPYFELNAMKRGMFYMAERLYGMVFTALPAGTVPVFHPDVEVFEVTDKETGRHIGLFYSDDFARSGKRSGAWMTTYRSHSTIDGERNVLASNNNNFIKAPAGEPLLISLDDTETLFHEFGHGIHYLLSTVNYPSLGGTPRDFVEYPSQVHEKWVLTRPILDQFARHYETGQAMPQDLLDKIEESSTFAQGYHTVSYLSSALVDMDLHNRSTAVTDPDAFEREALARIGMPRQIVMRHRLPQFNHLFTSDAYSAGYYSYLWSEVMDADTWAAFEETGDPFDPETARRFKEIILAPGNTTDRGEAYRQFRGRDPDVTALLRTRGFPTN